MNFHSLRLVGNCVDPVCSPRDSALLANAFCTALCKKSNRRAQAFQESVKAIEQWAFDMAGEITLVELPSMQAGALREIAGQQSDGNGGRSQIMFLPRRSNCSCLVPFERPSIDPIGLAYYYGQASRLCRPMTKGPPPPPPRHSSHSQAQTSSIGRRLAHAAMFQKCGGNEASGTTVLSIEKFEDLMRHAGCLDGRSVVVVTAGRSNKTEFVVPNCVLQMFRRCSRPSNP